MTPEGGRTLRRHRAPRPRRSLQTQAPSSWWSWRPQPAHLRPAESDARLAELLRDVNAPPTAAELCSPLALDDWRYTRSAHVAALRAAPVRRRVAVRRYTPLAPVLAAAASVAVVVLTLGGALWRGGALVVPMLAGVAGEPSGGAVASAPSSAPHRAPVKQVGAQSLPPSSSRTSSTRGTPPSSPSGSAARDGGSTSGSTVEPTDQMGTGSPVTVAGGPGLAGPTGAPGPAQPQRGTGSSGSFGVHPGAVDGSSGSDASHSSAPGPGVSSSSTAGSDPSSTGGSDDHGSASPHASRSEGHTRGDSPSVSPSDLPSAAATEPYPPVTEPCIGPQGQRLPPRACENLAGDRLASPLPATPSS